MCLFAACSAFAQYPAKPVRIIVPSAPGGGYDFAGRLLGDKLGAELGQPFIVENRVGAGTLVGTQAAATSAPDGYTLLMGGLANMAFNLGLHKDPRYDPVTDFTAVALVGAFTYALVARKDLAQSTLGEVLDFARANPGRLTIATSGIGTGQHISAVLLKRLAGVDLLEVAYKGAQPAYVDLLAGRVDLFFDNTTTARPFIADGRVEADRHLGCRCATRCCRTCPPAGKPGSRLWCSTAGWACSRPRRLPDRCSSACGPRR